MYFSTQEIAKGFFSYMSNQAKLYLIALASVAFILTGYFFGSNPQIIWDELLVAVLVLSILALLVFNYLWFIKPVKKIAEESKKIAEGNYNIRLEYTANADVNHISYGLNIAADSINRAQHFIRQIIDGKLEPEFQTANQRVLEKDPLAQALLQMKERLAVINRLEQERKWTSEGLARFAEILRANQRTEQEIAADIIANMVRYVNGIQGAIYVAREDHEDNVVLYLTASYALSAEHRAKDQILPGEGLVGQAFLEKEHFYLDNIPPEYTRIVSGLGESSPRCLLIAPLKVNEQVYGVVEIASLEPMPEYVINFVLRVSENIAATLATVIANEKNVRLLEEAQTMTEQLRAQEEEMRQNMEELMATQEEMARKQLELERSREQLQKAKEEIEKNEQELRKVTEEQKEMIARLDLQKKKLEANETVLKKAYEKMRQNQEEAEQKRKELEEVNKQLLAQKNKIEANEIILKKSYEKMRQQQKEFKAKEAELKLSKMINQALMNSIDGFYYACDASQDYRATLLEGNLQSLTGYPAEQFLKHQIHLGNIIHPDDKAYVDKTVEEAINDFEGYSLIYRIVRADGTVRKVWEKGYPIFDNQDMLSHLIGFVIDYDVAEKLNLINNAAK